MKRLFGRHSCKGLSVTDLDEAGDHQLPLDAVVEEVRAGLETTLRARAQAHDPALLGEVDSRLSGYTDARLPQ
jgi:hypothetical protein